MPKHSTKQLISLCLSTALALGLFLNGFSTGVYAAQAPVSAVDGTVSQSTSTENISTGGFTENSVPESTSAETSTPESTSAETSTPESTSAETSTPESTSAETSTPESTSAETSTPESTSSENVSEKQEASNASSAVNNILLAANPDDPAISTVPQDSTLAMAGKTTNTMTVDGRLLEDVWQNADRYSIKHLADFTINNNTSSFMTTWDDTNFYIGITVLDDLVVTKDNGILNDEALYNDDGVEIYIDIDNSKHTKWDKKNDTQIMLRHDGTMKVFGGPDGAAWSENHYLDNVLQKAVYITESGFNIEVAIPWSAFGVTPADGMMMGLDVTNNDNDSLTGHARKEITWSEKHTYGDVGSWGTVVLYNTRKPLVPGHGTPVVKNGNENWDPSLWNFNDTYSLGFKDIPGAALKFSALADSEKFYLALLVEGAGDANPGAELILSGIGGKSGGVDKNQYGYIMQYSPKADELWKKMNVARGQAGSSSAKYDLGNGSYAVVVQYPWNLLTQEGVNGDMVEYKGEQVIARRNFTTISFSIKTGTLTDPNDFSLQNTTSWTEFNAWGSNALDNTATIALNDANLVPVDEKNIAPDGSDYYTYSIAQGGKASGSILVTDANEGDVLTFSLEDGFDTANGTVTVDPKTGNWTYETPNATFVTEGATSVSFWIVAKDGEGASHRTRIEIKVEYAPTNLTYYVDGDTGSDSNDGLSPATALKTINAAHDKTKPGDTVLIYESSVPYGWYSDEEYAADPDLYKSVRNGVVVITRSGLPDAPITYKAAPGETPVLSGNAVWDMLVVSANYIVVDGLTVRGMSENQTYEQAWTAFWGKMADKADPAYIASWDQPIGAYNSNGIGVSPAEGRGMTGAGAVEESVSIPHHITIRNCTAEFMGGSGIGGSECDYVTFENNKAVNNCWWGMYGNSGLGFIRLVDIDDNTGAYKIVIRNNITAGNRHFIPWKAGTVRLSDGNGIIMDTCDEHAFNYRGKTLIANNLVYENGGSGIHSFRVDNVDIVNNTLFNNNATVELAQWGEVFSNDSLNVGIFNNIVYSRTGSIESPATKDYDYNLFYNYKMPGSELSGTTTSGTHNLYGQDPLFEAANAVVHKPAGFDTQTDYNSEWYKTLTAAADNIPNQWTIAANAAAAGWYPGANYDVTTYGYDFTLDAASPAIGKASSAWQKTAGGEQYGNRIGIFSSVGPAQVEKPVDKTELQKLVDSAITLQATTYTETSFQAMLTVLTEAKSLLKDETANQDMVDTMATRLQQAIRALIKKPTESVEKPESESKPEQQPTEPSSSSTQTPASAASSTPQTGDNMPLGLFVTLLAVSAAGIGGIAALRCKRKN